MKPKPAPSLSMRGGAFLALVITLAVSSIGVMLDEATLAAWMAHPVRLGADGSPPATTLQGAAWLRIALAALPWGMLTIVALLAAVLRRRPEESFARSERAPAASSSILLLVGILAVAIVVRVPLLGQSLWYDEIVPFGGYSLLGPGPTIGNYYSQANHVFSQLLLWCSASIVGADEFGLRAPAFLASLLAIVAVWGAVRTVADERTALLSAAIMAFMPLHVLAGTDARGYAITIATSAVALWGIASARETGRILGWLVAGVAVALGVWAHLVAVAFALGAGLLFAADLARGQRRHDALAGLLMLSGAALLTLLLYSPILPDFLALRGQFGQHSASVPSLLGPEMQAALLGLGGAWPIGSGVLRWLTAVPGLLLALVGAISLWRTRRERPLAWLALLGFLGFPVTIALVAVGDSWLYARFLLFALPSIAIAIAAGLLACTARVGTRGAVVACCGLGVLHIAQLWTLPPRQPLREALDRAVAESPRGRPVGVIGLMDNPIAYYGLTRGVEIIDFGLGGARFPENAARVPTTAIVVLYPDALPEATRERLRAAAFAPVARLDGWIDWGAGAVEVWKRAG
jgi:hypothetical protein